MSRVIVDVMLKPEIHDPQGDAVLSASHRLGFGNVTSVRQGKRFELEIDGPADVRAEQLPFAIPDGIGMGPRQRFYSSRRGS